MNIVISCRSETPIYEQIYEQLASQILGGELEPGSCLPSIRAVARELNISIITVKKAWEALERDELIYTHAGKGCFVSEHPRVRLEDKKFSLARERLRRELPYYRGLNLTAEELLALVAELYGPPPLGPDKP